MNTPTNTSRQAVDNPMSMFADMVLGGGIEGQERAGQAELLQSTTLPTEILHGPESDFTDLGFVFGPTVPGDDLFREATLPDGWTRKGSEHAMWSHLADERGINRVAVFYKAAFYDRRAHMGIITVGYDVGQGFVYGDAETPELHPELTAAELADVRTYAVNYIERAAEHPSIYGDRVPRAEALIAAVEAA